MATATEPTPPATPPRDPAPRPWTADEFARVRGLGLFPGVALRLDRGRIVDAATARPVTFTRQEFYDLSDAGFFRDQKVQLLGGQLLWESPMNPPNAKGLLKTRRALSRVFGDGFVIRPQLPLDLGLATMPFPDLAVVVGSIDDEDDEHPKTAVLVVEVADTTFETDTHEKASLYAAAGIPDYWVLDVSRGRLLVFRDPRPNPADAFGHTYAGLTPRERDGTAAPLAAPTSPLRVSELLP